MLGKKRLQETDKNARRQFPFLTVAFLWPSVSWLFIGNIDSLLTDEQDPATKRMKEMGTLGSDSFFSWPMVSY